MNKHRNPPRLYKNQNGLLVPRGPVTKRIIIEADDNGIITFSAFNVDSNGISTNMDTREMVLGLLKVCMDTSAVLFSQIRPEDQRTNGQESNNNEGVQ